MDLAEINSTLAAAENIPVLGGIVHDLRECVQIMTEIPVNADVFDHQADNLGKLFNEGAGLARELDDILSDLRAHDTWRGQAADDYLGPEGARGPESGAGGQLNHNLQQTLGTFSANKIAHQKSADFCRQVNGLQIALWGEVVVAVIGVGVIVAATASIIFSETDLATVPAVAADTAVASGTAGTVATLTATGGELTGELAAVVAQAEASLTAAYATAAALTTIKITAAALCLDIGLALFEGAWADGQSLVSPAPFNAQTDPLTPEQQQLAETLYRDAQSEGLNITLSEIEEMIARNPGLSDYQYGLLMRLWARGIRAFAVVDIAQDINGRTVWIDAAQLAHFTIKHGDEFGDLSDDEIIGLIMSTLMDSEPDSKVDDAYRFNHVDINGISVPLVIVINAEGRIISVFVPDP